MNCIGLVLKQGEKRATRLGEEVVRALKEWGKDVLLEPSCQPLAEAWKARTSANIMDEADLLVVLGGDGTILRAAALLNAKPTPVLGVNLGRVGFLADVLPDEAIAALREAIEGRGRIVTRMLLEVTLPDGRTSRVLNDVVIHWGGIARLIDLGIIMGDGREMEVRADGLIVATPMGSSAYSYAAGGPLLHPGIEGILLTPICPYAGLKRPLLVPADFKIELVLRKGEEFVLTLDGHTMARLQTGQSVRIIRSPLPFVVIKTGRRDYLHVLKEKLGQD